MSNVSEVAPRLSGHHIPIRSLFFERALDIDALGLVSSVAIVTYCTIFPCSHVTQNFGIFTTVDLVLRAI